VDLDVKVKGDVDLETLLVILLRSPLIVHLLHHCGADVLGQQLLPLLERFWRRGLRPERVGGVALVAVGVEGGSEGSAGCVVASKATVGSPVVRCQGQVVLESSREVRV
jgi:hypothetical protein